MQGDAPNSLLKNMVLYGIIGCIAAGTDTLLFSGLYYLAGVSWMIANCISVATGMIISFILNRRFNFKVLDHPIHRAAIFFSVGICGLLLSQLVIWLCTLSAMDMIVAKLISVVVVAAFQFTLNKLISFGIHIE